ncbi:MULTISPECIES: thiamine diphosphokinase [Leuconostoc]|uniref:Thiamine diphosphokinase n=1 Tax=Leuconostoc holzapfelii TaxID=434464 RepID=A0A846ZF67_9LACO|nr:thiamine diphosphokinase [Leuconostoc holzapfelii]NKZ17771.1 thiamine diphosphokinase [Leuconostoc holzapfelii]
MQINILAGGPTELWPDNLFEEPGLWIGADRGAWRLYQHGMAMMMAVGDFDSLAASELATLQAHLQANEIIHVQAEKDETDTELALRYAQEQKPDQIKVFGATGGRVDHLLSNLWLMADPVFHDIVEKTTFIDRLNTVSYVQPGEKTVRKVPHTKYLGFMPINDVADFHIIDAKYPLALTENVAKMWSSNEFKTDVVHISLKTGIVMVTQSRD